MTFVHQALTWGFLLALLPLLIHLINLMRRRRVKWAAMEFLLRSYKKHRKWIWLQQLLLLLARMAAVALVVAMVAQWITKKQWLAIFGAATTHHFVLLDDSYSMSERSGGSAAFDRAKQVIGEIAAQAAGQDARQKLTLIRFSRAAGADLDSPETDVTRLADLNAEIVDSNFDVLIEEKRRLMEVTELASGPRPALAVLNQVLEQGRDENHLVYVLSDFREKEWESPGELRQLLAAAEKSAEIHFVSCIDKPQPNLTLADLAPEPGTRAAGVPLFVNVTVRNHGTETARRVQVKILTHFYDPDVQASSDPGRAPAQAEEPPTVLIDEIPAGGSASRRVQVYFPRPGAHVVEAILPGDSVAADNRRWCVIEIAEGEPVLVVDGSVEQQHAYFLTSAFQPGQRTNTGIRAESQPPAYVRDATLDELSRFRAIYLLDVDRLDDRATENLEEYLRRGGGVGIFVGENVNRAFYTQRLYRDGAGFLPLPLDRDQLLPDDAVDDTPDFEVENHPVFSVFLGESNPFIRLVAIERYLQPPVDWKPGAQAPVEVLARLRNGDPLAVERRFGDGRVILFLTTLAPQWNNWAHDPSFVVALLKLQAYLAAAGKQNESQLVGSPITLALNGDEHLSEVSFVAPAAVEGESELIKRTAVGKEEDSPLLVVSLDGSPVSGSTGAVDRSGLYEAWLARRQGSYDVQRFALNTDPSEGNLASADAQALLSRLEPVPIKFRHADEFGYDFMEQAGYNRSLLLMGLLIVLLLTEQVLGYFASYHPAQGAAG